ncbi:MAG: HAD-IIIC family phosphatase [Jatrophihabitans sp.]
MTAPAECPPLTLADALRIVNRAQRGDGAHDSRAPTVGLACGFTPLHLTTFLTAYLTELLPGENPQVVEGTYGDVASSVKQLAADEVNGAVVILDWPDLDPRMALRGPAGGGADAVDIVMSADERLARIGQAITGLSQVCPVVVFMPTTGVPPALGARIGQLSPAEARLHALLADLAQQMAANPRIRVASGREHYLAKGDVRADFLHGNTLPTRQTSALMRTASALLFPRPAKKGLITDLDDTVWRGLVGEIGSEKVSWDLDAGSQIHVVYQQLLATLAREGVLLAICSKNDELPVTQALARADLLVASDRFFPVVTSWDAKSGSVDQILRAWNIGAQDVVVVDDNPRELAEIESSHPDITTIQFPTNDPDAAISAFAELRHLFWRDAGGGVDALRLDSIRSNASMAGQRDAAGDDAEFLSGLEATITIDVNPRPQDERALELINKTNQFNLNGIRHDARSWQGLVDRRDGVVITVDYADRFGRLGTISVLAGQLDGSRLVVDAWVLSCRAFTRRIEHHVLHALATVYGVTSIELRFRETNRNRPIAVFLDSVGAVSPDRTLRPDALVSHCSTHNVKVVGHGDTTRSEDPE